MNLVFASGVLVPQTIAGLEYFRGMREQYPEALFPPVPSLGDVPSRAAVLADNIQRRFPSGPIHIVAHSMGGLDSRYTLSRNLNGLGDPGRVVSLSTISTPHGGSPLADFLVAPKPQFYNFGVHLLYETITEAMRVLGLPAGALGDLTTVAAESFNARCQDLPHVKYFTYAGLGVASFILKPAHSYIEAVGRTPADVQNDGVVSLASAQRGGLAEPPWPADHFQEIGYDLNRHGFQSDFDHVAAIRRVVDRACALPEKPAARATS